MRAGTAYPSGPPEFTPGFCRVSVARSLVLCVVFQDRCLSFVLFLLVIILSVLLRFAVSDYPFGIFKIFLCFSFFINFFSFYFKFSHDFAYFI